LIDEHIRFLVIEPELEIAPHATASPAILRGNVAMFRDGRRCGLDIQHSELMICPRPKSSHPLITDSGRRGAGLDPVNANSTLADSASRSIAIVQQHASAKAAVFGIEDVNMGDVLEGYLRQKCVLKWRSAPIPFKVLACYRFTLVVQPWIYPKKVDSIEATCAMDHKRGRCAAQNPAIVNCVAACDGRPCNDNASEPHAELYLYQNRYLRL
jgi:hypothetical protein